MNYRSRLITVINPDTKTLLRIEYKSKAPSGSKWMTGPFSPVVLQGQKRNAVPDRINLLFVFESLFKSKQKALKTDLSA